MSDVGPIVRHMLVCDDVQPDPSNPQKVNVFGLITTIHALSDPPFPLHLPELWVYLVLTEGRGSGEGTVVIVRADSDEPVFSSAAHTLSFGPDPLAVQGLVFRIRDGIFPQPGLYWVEFRYNGSMLARQPLLVRRS